MTQHIMNSDLCDLGYLPSKTKRGDIIKVTRKLENCPWMFGDKAIMPGRYRIVSRKHFCGGSQEIERI